jgi:hypothetical protein
MFSIKEGREAKERVKCNESNPTQTFPSAKNIVVTILIDVLEQNQQHKVQNK